MWKYLLVGALLAASGTLAELRHDTAGYVLIGLALTVAMSRKPGPEDD